MKLYTSKAIMAVTFLLGASISCVEAKLDESLKGCYKGPGMLKDMGATKYQSTGACRELCKKSQNAVFALHDTDRCSCGDKYPPDDLKAASTDKTCILVSCPGFGDDRCGGKKSYAIYLTGLVDDPATEGSADDGDATKTSAPPQATITEGGHTVVVTNPGKPSSSGPNKAGIAAGVVVGVVAIGAIIGGIIFFFKYKKRQQVVDEYRRNATINNFVAGGKPSYSQNSTDSRLDPSMTSQRRQSNGSIADDQDFSRRVLKVTNPDGHY